VDLTVVSTYFPVPQDRGDPVRVLMALRAIARSRPYTLLVVRRPDTTVEQVAELRDLLPGVAVRDFAATPYRLNKFGPMGRYLEAHLDGLPPWVRTRYSAELHDRLRERTGLAIAFGEAAGAYFSGTRLSWHWDKANVLAASTREDIREAPDLPHRLRARYLSKTSAAFEARALSRCRTVSVTSAEEAERLHHHHGRHADFTLPSCVPVPADHVRAPEPGRLVWLGSFSYASNVLGLRRFLSAGWPSLRRAGLRLTLVGSGLTDQLRAEFAAYDGVEILGYVADLRPVLAAAEAAVVPLWSGAGVKLKTLTLLAHSVPVFSTPAGVEGIPPTPATRIAETPEALAAGILRTTPADFDRMAQCARAVAAEFSEERFTERLCQGLASLGYLGGADTTVLEGS
jgi:hypothetical protein